MNLVLGLVLATAVLHAGWNALAKAVGDQWVSSALIGMVNGVFGIGCAVVFGVPAAGAWPFLVVSALLQAGYLMLLTKTYAHGDMSRLYPIARGTSPIVVTAVAVIVLGERLSPVSWIGLLILVAGIGMLALARGVPAGRRHQRLDIGVVLAVLTGLMIASYSLSDGVGVRLSHNPGAYIGWLFALQGPVLITICRWRGGPDFWTRMRTHAARGLAGGVLSVSSYGVVVWAQSRAPLALVSGLRETSVVWAALIGRIFLAERLVPRELLAIAAAATGAALLQVGA